MIIMPPTNNGNLNLENNMDSLKIKGMSCQHCVGSVQDALEKISGLSQVTVNLDAGEAHFESSGVDRAVIRNAIKGIGFDPGE